MINNFGAAYKQAFEACIDDTISFMDLYLRVKDHPKAPMILNGLIAHASMFVIENHRCLTTLLPAIKSSFSPSLSRLLYQSRHRAKLLDNSKKSIEETTTELISIAKRQRELFIEPHRGFLGPIKRAFQPDIGLSICDNHIFTTTHTVVFAFGKEIMSSESATKFGFEIGAYLSTVFSLFQIGIPSLATNLGGLPGRIEMRDTKYETLYNRSALGALNMEISAGLILILANLNFISYILSGLLPSNSLLLFRMKFMTAFHANFSIKLLQHRLINKSSLPKKISLFEDALANDDSKWLRKQLRLRNLITHYLPDENLISKAPPNTSRINTIESYSGDLSFADINSLLNRNITYLASLLEAFFNLKGDPFWLGKVF